jgi:DtxR family Mn-dependent transcriptional regulator
VVDPHGAPIPTREGTIDETRHKSLADLEEGQRAKVLRVSDEDGTFLRYLSDIGITPGVAVQVTSLGPYEGPIALKVGKARASVGVTAAKRIIVGDVSLKSKD